MALKPDRVEDPRQDINWFMNEVAERGGVVVQNTSGSGGYPGNALNVATYAANPSGRAPLGILLVDMVNVDLTRYHTNFYREQVPMGYKVVLGKTGDYTTNFITGTPSGGAPAYLAASGYLSPTQATGASQVGTFLTSLDEDGYARVRVKLG